MDETQCPFPRTTGGTSTSGLQRSPTQSDGPPRSNLCRATDSRRGLGPARALACSALLATACKAGRISRVTHRDWTRITRGSAHCRSRRSRGGGGAPDTCWPALPSCLGPKAGSELLLLGSLSVLRSVACRADHPPVQSGRRSRRPLRQPRWGTHRGRGIHCKRDSTALRPWCHAARKASPKASTINSGVQLSLKLAQKVCFRFPTEADEEVSRPLDGKLSCLPY